VFKRNVYSFVALAKSRGIKVVRYPLHDEFVRHHESYNRAIEEVATEEGVIVADNDKALGGDRALFSDDVHYTLEGVRRLAASYADVLERDRLVH